jgi:transcriptional regulator with XRE-family HTH domain
VVPPGLTPAAAEAPSPVCTASRRCRCVPLLDMTASRPDTEIQATRVGETLSRRIRSLRMERGLSLRRVAGVAQISPSLLSQIERGEANPSLVSLMAIAEALNVRPGALLDEADSSSRSPAVRRSERRVVQDELCRREYLMHPDEPKLEVAEVILEPGGSSPPTFARHSGRDYGVVLEGTATVELASQKVVLEEGDYIAYDAQEPHRILNESDARVRLMWVVAFEGPGPTGGV